MNRKLLPDEKEIEDNIDLLKPVSEEKKSKINAILDTAKINKDISLQISNYDLGRLKERAEREGIPYQVLINSILHKYVTNQLIEKKEMVDAIRMMNSVQI